MTTLDVKPLADRIRAYNPSLDVGFLTRAFDFARDAHDGQTRASGAPYFTHPIAVAHILADMHVDSSTIVTALLHDVVEDTEATIEMVSDAFGADIARLVDGVTKLTRIEMQSDNKQAENFRKLVLAMSEDIRVLLVKLADRTHNMRTIDFIGRADKRERIAKETLSIFVPLAERVGMTRFQHELEDRAFAVLHPDMRESILTRLHNLSSQSEDAISHICSELNGILWQEGMDAGVSGRLKSAYSIWRKMQKKKVEMEELSDIMAFRVIVPTYEECYRTLGILHQKFPMVMGRFKDYISTPKQNHYQSIHTCIIGPNKKRIEVQIRTPEMHEVSERGVAAHWNYKSKGSDKAADSGRQYNWLNDLVQVLDNAETAEEFLEHTEMEMYTGEVFCFTPKGDLIVLPKGATAVDFAYAIHSKIGETCTGIKINGKRRQLATVLNNGDQVAVITAPDAMPHPEWENFVVTGRAKSSLRRFMRLEQQKQFIQLGQGLLRKAFRQAGKKPSPKKVQSCLQHFGLQGVDDLHAQIGENLISPEDVLRVLYPDLDLPKITAEGGGKSGGKAKKPSLNIKGLKPGMAVHHGRCCHPLPGERIVGIITTGKGITVHRVDCNNIEKFSAMPELWVDIEWQDKTTTLVNAQIEITLTNKAGSLASMTRAISDDGGNITNIQLTARAPDFFTFMTDIEVSDARHLQLIMVELRSNPFVESVERAKS